MAKRGKVLLSFTPRARGRERCISQNRGREREFSRRSRKAAHRNIIKSHGEREKPHSHPMEVTRRPIASVNYPLTKFLSRESAREAGRSGAPVIAAVLRRTFNYLGRARFQARDQRIHLIIDTQARRAFNLACRYILRDCFRFSQALSNFNATRRFSRSLCACKNAQGLCVHETKQQCRFERKDFCLLLLAIRHGHLHSRDSWGPRK